MRKLIVVLVLLIAACGSAAVAATSLSLSEKSNGITMLERDTHGLTLRISLGSLIVDQISTKSGTFTSLTANGLDHSPAIGEPRLPVVNRLFAIPLDCEMSAEVISSDAQEFSLTDLGAGDPLLPVQPSLSKSQDPDDVPFQFKQDVYARAGYYQLPAVSVKVVGLMRGVRVGWISVAPVQYSPLENRIKVSTEMTIRVAFDSPDWSSTSSLFTESYSPAFEPAYGMLMNSDDEMIRLRNDLTRYPMTMVILSDRVFESQLQPFITWKIRKGFKVIVGYTDSIGTTTTAIKSYLQGLYDAENPKPSFVLLVGDTPQIPAWPGSTETHVTDLPYCEYTGDNLPEVYYGRFSARSAAELQPQIDKTLEYEQYAMPDPSYLGHSLFVSGVDPSFALTYGNGEMNYATNLYFNTAHGNTPQVWLYPASGGAGVPASIVAQINQGSGFSVYTGHGSHDGWFLPSFTVSDVNNLTNAHICGMAIVNACFTNTYGDATPCLGEAWLRKADGGGIGYIGCSGGSFWEEDYWWAVGGGKAVVASGPAYDSSRIGAFDGLCHDHNEPAVQHFVTNAAINVCGLLAVEQSSSLLKTRYWEIYCLMGDPSVSCYLRVPTANAVAHSPLLSTTATTLRIVAEPGSYVALSSGGVLHGASLVPPEGSLDLPITPFDLPGIANLVVTGQNLEPYTTVIQVLSLLGDADNSGAINIADAVFIIEYVFAGGKDPTPLEAGDVNCDGMCNVSDAVYLIAFIFEGGPAPCAE